MMINNFDYILGMDREWNASNYIDQLDYGELTLK